MSTQEDTVIESTTKFRAGLPDMPQRIARLPADSRGYPVPWFVAWVDGEPDFRVVDGRKMSAAVKHGRCWLCGEQLGRYHAYVIGPMCAINRVSSEPPSHRDCAEFAVRACPFLTLPRARRRELGLPDEAVEPGGCGLKRNPGVSLLWITRDAIRPFRADADPRDPGRSEGVLFHVGEPVETLWFAEGREATRAEIVDSIDSGYPALAEIAEAEGRGAPAALRRAYDSALALLPA